MNALVPVQASNAEIYRASTDAAGLCREIVLQTAMTIQKRKYVKVEGWQAIAIAHGCTGSARDVEIVEGGVRAIGEVRRMSDGALIATAEGFVGQDEPTWFGGEAEVWEWGERRGERVKVRKVLEKRADYAIRAMAQTRAISRACRSAFAHVVVLIDSNLSTTPAEEVPVDGFGDQDMRNVTPQADATPDPEAAATEERAINVLRGCGEKAWLKEAWETNQANWKAKLPAEAWARVCGVMEECVAKFRPAKAEPTTNGHDKSAEVAPPQPGPTPFDDEIPF